MTTYTKGPWKSCKSVDGEFLGVYPATGKMEFPIAKMPEYIVDEVNEANALLIATAPEMLGSLHDVAVAINALLENPEDESRRPHAKYLAERAMEIVAKAEGRS